MPLSNESMKEPMTTPLVAPAAPEPTPEPEPVKAPRGKCPTCHGELERHGDANPYKVGASHCNQCGSCWKPGLRELREGHPPPSPAPGA